jgi:hypothetical protein
VRVRDAGTRVSAGEFNGWDAQAAPLARIDPCARAVTHFYELHDPGFAGQPSYDLDARPEPRDGMPFSGDIGPGAYTAIVLSQGG